MKKTAVFTRSALGLWATFTIDVMVLNVFHRLTRAVIRKVASTKGDDNAS